MLFPGPWRRWWKFTAVEKQLRLCFDGLIDLGGTFIKFFLQTLGMPLHLFELATVVLEPFKVVGAQMGDKFTAQLGVFGAGGGLAFFNQLTQFLHTCNLLTAQLLAPSAEFLAEFIRIRPLKLEKFGTFCFG